MPEFVPATEVRSPRSRWSLIEILDDPHRPHTCVLALGRWDDRHVLAMRWNGDAEKPIGNPHSRGLPTWFIAPERFNDPLINTLSQEMQQVARRYLSSAQEHS